MPKRPELKGLGAQFLRAVRPEEAHPVETFTAEGDPAKILNLPVQSIAPNPDQPRKHFDEGALASLTRSIQERGILQPIVVRRADEGEGFIILAGERRWRAAQGAGLKKIPTLVRQGDDQLEIALIENVQRQDLHPLEEAEALNLLKDRRGLTDEALACIVGKSRSTVTELLTLNSLPDEIKDECRTSDNYTKSLLLRVVRESNRDARLALWRTIKAGQLSVQAAREASKRQRRPGPKRYEFKYQPETPTFTVRVTFRKGNANSEEIQGALRQALKSLDT